MKRTPAQIQYDREHGNGCCERWNDNSACDCMLEAYEPLALVADVCASLRCLREAVKLLATTEPIAAVTATEALKTLEWALDESET